MFFGMGAMLRLSGSTEGGVMIGRSIGLRAIGGSVRSPCSVLERHAICQSFCCCTRPLVGKGSPTAYRLSVDVFTRTLRTVLQYAAQAQSDVFGDKSEQAMELYEEFY